MTIRKQLFLFVVFLIGSGAMTLKYQPASFWGPVLIIVGAGTLLSSGWILEGLD